MRCKTVIKDLLKSCIPRSLRRQRSVLGYALRELRYQFGPAPMREFANYDEYWSKRGNLDQLFRRWQVAAGLLRDRTSLCDVGCGTGEFLQYVRTQKPSVDCIGLDFSLRAVELTRAAGFEADVVNIVSERLPGEYDYVTCFEVLEHIADAEVALSHLKAAFRKNLIVSIPNVAYFACRLRLGVLGRFPITNCQLHIKEHVRHWGPKDFRDWAAAGGLKVVHAEGQYGMAYTPWRKWPSLFASGMIYVLEHADAGFSEK